MLTVHVLGAGGGRPSARRDTTSLLVRVDASWTLVDCPGGVVHKLARWSVVPEALERIVVTHDHVDHVYGFPHLIHAMGMVGAGRELPVHAPASTIAALRAMIELHGLEGERFPRIGWRAIAPQAGAVVFESAGLRVTAAPGVHSRPTAALRFSAADASFGHSSDTAFSPALGEFFRGVDLLTHDCAGLHADRERFGATHSSAREAGEIAGIARAEKLGLIHLGELAEQDEGALETEARQAFGGDTMVLRDNDVLRVAR